MELCKECSSHICFVGGFQENVFAVPQKYASQPVMLKR